MALPVPPATHLSATASLAPLAPTALPAIWAIGLAPPIHRAFGALGPAPSATPRNAPSAPLAITSMERPALPAAYLVLLAQ